MKTVTVKLPLALSARLDRAAKRRGQTRSEVVREALQSLLGGPNGNGNSSKVRQPQSALDLAGDLVGCIQGPGDLSTNRSYLDGFGK
jgi:Arc/MetJ-type ribon-helix-helix transcriptional regulator